MSVSCPCVFDEFVHLSHNVGGMDFPSIANLFVGWCYLFFVVSAAVSQMMTLP